MAAITAAMVKDLREQSGAGMMDCKKALAECDGDMDAAFELLRKNGAAKAEKKASRIAAEGICKVVVEGNTAVVLEVNSETDFVAKNEKFQAYVEKVANQILKSDVTTIDELLAQPWAEDSSKTVNDVHVEMVATIGEKLSLRRFEKVVSDGFVVSYTHGGGRIGVIVEVSADSVNDQVTEAATNVAMQIAALNPKYVSDADVDQEYLNHEKEILLAQINNDPKEASKPDKVKEGMVTGRIKKELKEICLLDQVYVKAEDGKQSVAQYLDQVSKACGTTVAIKQFIRFETGEGLEKKNEDFAAEVAKQMGM